MCSWKYHNIIYKAAEISEKIASGVNILQEAAAKAVERLQNINEAGKTLSHSLLHATCTLQAKLIK